MTSADTSSASTLKPAKITCIQPGGGFCFNLERTWGIIRRSILRKFCPGHVKRMAEKRQGECPQCPHDIIDSRDLKLYRNVCGYWFRPEDDRYRWRDRIPLARPGLAEVVYFTFIFLLAGFATSVAAALLHPIFWGLFGIEAGLWLFMISFFRNPRRRIPLDPNALVSPADGTVTHVDEVEDADFPGGKALRISIFLSVFNVHVNRIPRNSKVIRIRYFPGEFLDARHKECAVRNEQLWLDLEEPSGRQIRVKQISGAIARRIVCCLKEGELVRAGELFGMIKFGSRTEVLIAKETGIEMKIKVGDKVRGGSSILLQFYTQNQNASRISP
jgi:phosphatidylserine decarboxylase